MRPRDTIVKSNTNVVLLFGQLNFWVLTRRPNKMPFVLCKHMNYKVLWARSVQLWLDFAYRAQGRVTWFPMATLVHFCWNQALPVGRLLSAAVSFGQVGGSATISQEGAGGCGWASQLAAMSHTEDKNPHGLPQQPGKFQSQGRRHPRWLLGSWHMWLSMDIWKIIHPAPKQTLAFTAEQKSK